MQTHKYSNLVSIVNRGLNVHEFSLINSKQEMQKYVESNPLFTVRFDATKLTFGLPFFKYDSQFKDVKGKVYSLDSVVELAEELNCSMLCANGFTHDPNQIYNFVYKLDSFDNLVIELSYEKIPLRDMYNGNTLTFRGNLRECEFDLIGNSVQRKYFSKTELNKLIGTILETGIRNKWCECTYYPYKVGVLHDEIVYWQLVD